MIPNLLNSNLFACVDTTILWQRLANYINQDLLNTKMSCPRRQLPWEKKIIYKQIELRSPRVAAGTKNNPSFKKYKHKPGKEDFGWLQEVVPTFRKRHVKQKKIRANK